MAGRTSSRRWHGVVVVDGWWCWRSYGGWHMGKPKKKDRGWGKGEGGEGRAEGEDRG